MPRRFDEVNHAQGAVADASDDGYVVGRAGGRDVHGDLDRAGVCGWADRSCWTGPTR